MNKFGIIKFALSFFLIQTIFFFLYRILFAIKYFEEVEEPIGAFYNSLQVDTSTVSYFTFILIVLIILFRIINFKGIEKVLNIYSYFLCSFFFIVEYSSLSIYSYWGSTLTYRAISYLENGNTGWSSIIESIDSYLLPAIILFITHIYSNRKLNSSFRNKRIKLKSLLLLPILLLLMRGGLQIIPINSSKSFYSKNQTENYCAVNKVRYFLDSYLSSKSYNSKIRTKSTSTNIDSLMNIDCNDYSITSAKNPDIVLLILEGIPNAALSIKKNNKYITENISELSERGIQYTNAFSSGFRTDQGLVSIFNGLPAYPFLNTLKKYDRLDKHDNLINKLHNNGYNTSFIYGGESQFSDMKKFFLKTNLDNLIDSDYFPKSDNTSSWGVPDHILLDTASSIISRSISPSFTSILTSSTHVPFDFPNHNPNELSIENNFIASIEYLDEAIGLFTQEIFNFKDRKIVLIITSDHGSMHLGHGYNDHERFHIPLIVSGNCIDSNYINTKKHKNISLHDMPLSIINITSQSESNSSLFGLSTNIFSSCSNSNSYWVTDNALGYIENSVNLGLEHRNKKIFQHNLKDDSLSLKELHKNAISTFNHYTNFLLSK